MAYAIADADSEVTATSEVCAGTPGVVAVLTH